MKKILVLLLPFLLFLGANAQVTVDNTSQSVEQWVQNVLAGQGVVITNVQFNGSAAAAQLPNEQVGSFNDINSDVGLANGLILGSGNVSMAQQLNIADSSSLGGSGTQGVDLDLASITPNQIWDESVVEFDFVPQGDTISFNYVFASEEYEEFVCSNYNDVFGFFLSGNNPLGGTYNAQNLALIPDPSAPGTFTTTPVAINTVNQGPNSGAAIFDTMPCFNLAPNWSTYSQFYTPNTTNTYEYDGKTVVLQARAYVNCGETYHIKLAIGDGFDPSFDSGVFIEGGSFSSEAVLVNVVTATGDSTVIEGCADATINFTRPDTAGDLTVHFEIGGNAINGTDYVFIPDSVTFLAGQDTANLNIFPIADFDFTEGEDTISITAFTINVCGDTITSTGYIYILDLPNMTVSSQDTILACPTSTVPISVLAGQALQPFTYEWFNDSINGQVIPNPTNSNTIMVSGMVTDTFYVSVSDSCDLVTLSDTIIVSTSVNQPQIDSTTVDSLILCGGSISMQAFIVPGTGTAPFSFSWNGVAGNPSPMMNPTADSTFYVTVTDFCNLTDIDSVLITVDTIPVLMISHSNDTTINCGESMTLQATATNGPFTPQYIWTIAGGAQTPAFISPQTTTTYIIEATGSCAANAFDTVVVTVDTIPVIFETTNDINLFCTNEILTLAAYPTDGVSNYDYFWTPGGNSDTIIAVPAQSITFYVTATGVCNASATDSVVITVDYTPLTLSLSDSITLKCPNLAYPVEVIATVANGTTPYTYNWNASSDNDNIINFSANANQTVSLTVTDDCMQQVSADMYISYGPYTPMITHPLPVDSVCLGETTELGATPTFGIPPYSYSWSDGVNTYSGNPTIYSSLTPGINNITLTVTDQCTNTQDDIDVLVISCNIITPNVFTPNGDLSNDLLVFENLEFFPNNKIQIFNRWGKKIYEKENYQNNWDGDGASDGTYFYIIELNNFDNTLHKGSFIIFK